MHYSRTLSSREKTDISEYVCMYVWVYVCGFDSQRGDSRADPFAGLLRGSLAGELGRRQFQVRVYSIS